MTVEATTPSKPSIKVKADAKKHTVTVTYTASEGATGYDVILGDALRKVNGETRPVEYGKRVIKNIGKNTLSVTFTDVADGTYYAGVHSFNRTAADGSKVFSKWAYKTVSVGEAK